jgi:hypothetical protein
MGILSLYSSVVVPILLIVSSLGVTFLLVAAKLNFCRCTVLQVFSFCISFFYFAVNGPIVLIANGPIGYVCGCVCVFFGNYLFLHQLQRVITLPCY